MKVSIVSTKLKSGVVLGALGALVVSAYAVNVEWKGGDGRWDDPAMWKGEAVPLASETAVFAEGIGGRVELVGTHVVAALVVDSAGQGLPDAAPVTFYGGGTLTANLELAEIRSGRQVVVSNACVVLGATVYVGQDGPARLEVCAGGLWDVSAGRTWIHGGSTLHIEGGEVRGNLTVNAGGCFRMTAGVYRYTQKTDGLAAGAILDVTGGTIIYGSELRKNETFIGDDAQMMAFWPDRMAKTLVVDAYNSSSFGGNCVGIGYSNDVYRLSGALFVTNHVPEATTEDGRLLVCTNAAFYGRGTFTARSLSHGQDQNMPLDFGLSAVRLEQGLINKHITKDKIDKEMTFHGTTTFGAWGDWSRAKSSHVLLRPEGELTFDTADCNDASAAAHTLALPRLLLDCPWSVLAFVGGGSVDCLLGQPRQVIALRTLDIGADTAASFAGDGGTEYWIKDFAAASGAQVTVPFKCLNSASNISIVCMGSSRVASGAQFTAIGDYASVAGSPGSFYHVFTAAPGGDWPDPAQWNLQLVDEPAGSGHSWEMRVTGPTVYVRDGNMAPYSGNTHWTGAVSGNFSDAGNWSDGAVPSSAVWLAGETRTIVTNDIDSFKSKGLRVASDAGPFVVHGNTITVNRTAAGFYNAQIQHYGQFPLVLECPIVCSSYPFYVANDGPSYVAFMNELSLAQSLTVRGRLLVEGALTATGIDLQDHASVGNGTLLGILEHGHARFTAQSAAFTNAAPFAISAGGRLTFEGGAFTYGAVTNMHIVDGTLDIRVPLSAAASDAGVVFAGTGVVQVASVKSAPCGDALVQLNGGVTLVPPSEGWTTVTSEAADHAITLALPEWGRAVLAPTNDFVYGPAAGVTPTGTGDRALAVGRFGCLTLAGDANFRFADAIVCGAHSTLVKRGAGCLVWDNAAHVAPERLEIEGGTFAWSEPVAVSDLVAAPGTTLAFGATEGTVSPLAVTEGDVDLDGVTILPATEAARNAAAGGVTVLTVSANRSIKGMPTVGDNIRIKLVDLPGGGQALQLRVKTGTVWFVR